MNRPKFRISMDITVEQLSAAIWSSVDLTPSLLSMYDKLKANGSQPSLHNGSHGDCPAQPGPEPTPAVKLLADEEKRLSETMDTADGGLGAGQKRPLSVGSASSSTSVSAQPGNKRPNLGERNPTTTTTTAAKPTLLALAGCRASTDSFIVGDDWVEVNFPDAQDEDYYEQIDLSSAAAVAAASLPVVKVYSPQSSTGSNDDVSLNSSTYSDDKGDNSAGGSGDTVQSTYSLKLSNANHCGSVSLGKSDSGSLSQLSDRNSNGSLHSPVLSKDSTYYVSYAQRVASEIVETEKMYVHSLQEIIEGYMKPIKQCGDITQDQSSKLFGNLEDIYEFNKGLLAELEECGEDPVEVAHCFVEKNEGFEIYTEYCTKYPASMEILTNCMLEPSLAEKFKCWQAALGHGLPLGAYLLKPVQRILKYHLLLQNIVKHYDDELPGYDTLTTALGHMTHMAHHINEMKRRHEHAVRVQEVQSQLEDYHDGPNLSTLGELVLEGNFRLLGAKASRSVFLFEKGILITKRKEEGTFSCKAMIVCSNLMLVESVPKEPLSFHVIPFDNTKLQYTLQAHNIEMKRKWCQEIKRLILESYMGRIPDKVKSLVMGLGRTKAEEEELHNHGYHLSPEQNDKKRPRRKSANLMDLVKLKKGHRKNDTTPPRLAPVNVPNQTKGVTSSGGRLSTKQSNQLLSGSRSMDNLSVPGSHTLPRGRLPSNGTSPGPQEGDTGSQRTFLEPDADPNLVRRAKSFKIATRMNPMSSLDVDDDDNSSGESMEVSTDEEHTEDDVYVSLVKNGAHNGAEEFSDLGYGARVASMPSLSTDQDEPDYVTVRLNPDQGLPVSSQSHLAALTHANTSKSAECLTSADQDPDQVCQRVEVAKDNQLSVSTSSSYDNLNKRWSSSSATVEEEEEEEGEGTEEGVPAVVVPPPAEFADSPVTPELSDTTPVEPQSADPWVKQSPSVVVETEVSEGGNSELRPNKKRHLALGKSLSFPLRYTEAARCLSQANFDWYVYSNRISSSLAKQLDKLQVLEKQGFDRKYPGYVTDLGVTDTFSLEQRKAIVQYGTPPRCAFTPEKMNQYAALHKDCQAADDGLSSKTKTKPKTIKPHCSLSTPHTWKPRGKMDKTSDKALKAVHPEDPLKIVKEMENYAATHHPVKGKSSNILKFPSAGSSVGSKLPEEKFKQSPDFKLHAKNKDFKLPSDKHSDYKLPFDRNGDFKLTSDRTSDFRLPGDRTGDFKLTNDRTGDFKLTSDRTGDFRLPGDRNSDSWSQKSRDSFSSGGNFMSRSRESLSSSTSSLNKLKPSPEPYSLSSMSESDSGQGTFRSKLSHLTSWLTARKHLPTINSAYTSPQRGFPSGQYKSAFNARYRAQGHGEHKPEGFVSHLTRIYNARQDTSPPRAAPKRPESSTPEKTYTAVLRQRQLGSPALGSRLASSSVRPPEPKARSLPRPPTDLAPNPTGDNASVHSLDLSRDRSPDPALKPAFPSHPIQQSDSAVSIQSRLSDADTPLSPSSWRRSSCDSLDSSTDSIYERRFSRALEEPDDTVFRDSAVYSDMDSTSAYAIPASALSPPRKSIREVVQQLEERARPKPPEVQDVRRREPGRTIQEKLKSLRESAQYHRRRSQRYNDDADDDADDNDIHGSARRLREIRRSLGSSRSSVDRDDPGFTIRYSRGYLGQDGAVKMTRSTGRLDQLDTDVPTLTTMKGWVRQLINKFQADQ